MGYSPPNWENTMGCYSAADRQLNCFQFGDIVESVAINIRIQVSFCVDMFLFLLGKILRSKIAGLYDECGLSG